MRNIFIKWRKCKRKIKPKEQGKQNQDGRAESSAEGVGGEAGEMEGGQLGCEGL